MRIVFLFLLFITACSLQNNKDSEKALHLALSEEPLTVDPRLVKTLNCSNLCQMLFEGLMSSDKNGELSFGIADHVELSKDHLVYVFHLKDAVWSDGSLVTAQNFVDSWKSSLDPAFPASNVNQLFPIKGAKQAKLGEKSVEEVGVVAIDLKTLQVELESPTPYFLKLCSLPIYFPIPSKEGINSDSLVVNGPFLIEKWRRQDKIVLSKNKSYWNEKDVVLNKIEFAFLKPETALQLFELGKLDWAGSPISYLPSESLETLAKTCGYQKAPLRGTSFIRVNTTRAKLSDSEFRKKIGFAINRDEITKTLLHGSQKTATRFVPPEMGLNNPDLIEAIGIENAKFEGSITLMYAEDPRTRAIAQAIQGQLNQALSVNIELEAQETRVYYEKLRKGNYELAICSWIADFDDPINFLELFQYQNQSGNMTGWESAEYLEQLNQSVISEGDERLAVLAKAERILMNEMPIIPIFHFQMNYLQNKDLDGVVLRPTGLIDCRFAKLDGLKR